MSAPEEKDLRKPRALPGTCARATLRQLLARWGKLELVRTNTMGDEEEVWFWVSGTGAEALFEKREAT